MRRIVMAATVTSMAILAACGSTESASDTTTSAPPTSAATTSTTAADAPTTTAAPPPGVDGDTVKIGFTVVTNQQQASEQAGATGITTISQSKAVEILVKDLNDRGGLGGKKVEPVLFETDATATVDPQTIARNYCATFTQDNTVYAVVTPFEPSPENLACLNAAGTPAIVSSGVYSFLDAKAYADAPLLVNASGIDLDTAATTFVKGLSQAGWFEPGAKVGLMRLQSDTFDRAATAALEPALAAAGVTLVAQEAIGEIKSQDDIGRVSTAAQNAVLKMKDAGVDHLMFFESGGALPFFFLSAASSQSFAPKLAFTSMSGGQSLVLNIKNGGTAVSWYPVGDVPLDKAPRTAEGTGCLTLLDPTGAAFTSAVATSQALSFCDALALLEAGVKAGGLVDGKALVTAIEGLGTFPSRVLDTATFSPSKRFGVATYRIADYDAGCKCNVFRAGDPTPIG